MISEEPPFRSLARHERRERIVWAAKFVMLEKGLEAASMDDVAARAGTTKPTVYAHFKSKDELFSAVVEQVKGFYLAALRSPDVYADEPVEAVSLFCGRVLELGTWRDVIGHQRLTLAGAGRSPTIARAVYESTYGEARRALAAYLRARKLTRKPEANAELILSATTGGTMIRHLFGVDEPSEGPPGDEIPGTRADMKKIREIVGLIASKWKVQGRAGPTFPVAP